MSKVISIINQKGGVGKTTTTKAMALGLAEQGKHVLAIDLDPQGNLSMGFGVDAPDDYIGVGSLLNEYTKIRMDDDRPLADEFLVDVTENIDLMIGNDDLDTLDISLSAYSEGLFFLDTILSDIKARYDYILIDCRPSIGNLTKSALISSDEIIIPTEPQFYSAKGIQKLLKEIAQIQKRFNPHLRINGVLPTRIDLRTKVSKKFLTVIENLFSDQKIYDFIPLSTKIAETSEGADMFTYDPHGQGVCAYRKFVNDFLKGE